MNSSMENRESLSACEYRENLGILRETYLFAKLPLDALKVFAYLFAKEIYHAGDYLFRQGEEDGQAFILLSGTARLIHEAGGKETVLRDYTIHDFLGSLSLFAKIQRVYSLKALIDTSALVISREKFSRTMAQFPALLPVVMQALTEQVVAWEKKILTQHADHCENGRNIIGVSLI